MNVDRYPADYDEYAVTYAWARSAVPWVLEPLARLVDTLPAGAIVLDLGCGTGNYSRALAAHRAGRGFIGFDRSEPMLREAQRLPPAISLVCGDAARELPYRDGVFALAFAVDVIQHIDDVPRFFREASRVLARERHLIVVTDSPDTMARRSLTTFFPEVLPIELARYPELPVLHEAAARAGLTMTTQQQVSGEIALTDEFLARLAAKCSSAMRLISPADHAAGMARVRAGRERGECWVSHYELVCYRRTV